MTGGNFLLRVSGAFRRPARKASPADAGRRGAETFLQAAEREAQRRAGIVRLVVAGVLILTVEVAANDVPGWDPVIMRQVEAARIILMIFAFIGLVVYLLARHRIATRVLPFLTALADAALILGNLAYNHASTGLAGNFAFTFPVVWVIPIALAGNAIYFRPGLQVFATGLYVVGLVAISWFAGDIPPGERVGELARLQLSFAPPPNLVRLMMIVGAGLLLILAARQGRRLLERAVEETRLRANLTRYLPGELAPVPSEDAFAHLRAGRRIQVALLFVDIRESSLIGESMTPAELARFITAFRRRVTRGAAEHGGVIDKFIGDGALVLFGVPTPTPADASRALACGRTLLALVDRWNQKRRPSPPVRIGVGVHCGEMFCGVVGDEGRLEFTVLGEPVNGAARLEKANKTFGTQLLASREVVEAAGETGRWVEVSREPLPGTSRPITVMAPADERSSPVSPPAERSSAPRAS